MEGDEAGELKEHAEHGSSESGMRPVAFTMAVLAVLVAIATVLGHRTHTEAILTQNRATDQWNFYQAHKIRSNDTALAADLLGVVTVSDPKAAAKLAQSYADHQAKWAQDLDQAEKQAHELEDDVRRAEARATRFDLAEALLEIGLVVTSVTLLTRSRMYWYFGLLFALAGIVSAASAYLPR
jgi:hypothetical protein